MFRLFVTLAFLVGSSLAQYENHYYSDSDYYQTKFYEEPVNYDHYEPYAQVQKTPVENVVDQFHNLVDRQSNGLRRQGIGLIIAPFIFPIAVGLVVAGIVAFVAIDADNRRNEINDRVNSLSSEVGSLLGNIRMLTNQLAQNEARINALQMRVNTLEMENMGGGQETTPSPDDDTTMAPDDGTTMAPEDDSTMATEDDSTMAPEDDSAMSPDYVTDSSTLIEFSTGSRDSRMERLFRDWSQVSKYVNF